MLHLLAQAANQIEVKAAEKALDAVGQAAASQPALYLLVFAVLAILVVNSRQGRENTRMILDYIRGQDDATQSMMTEMMDRTKEGSDACHQHSLLMMNQRNEGSAILKECVGELHGVTTDLKVAVGNIGNAAQQNLRTAEALLQMSKRLPPEHT